MQPDLSSYTIVFDLDGTLVDTAPDLAAAANHVFDRIGLAPVSPAELHPYISRGSRAMIEAGLRLHGVAKSEAEVGELHQLFLPYYETNIAVLSRPFEGVPELLDALRGAGARIAVCTNKFECCPSRCSASCVSTKSWRPSPVATRSPCASPILAI
jgi:phosphoglycolate phosphatase